MTHVIQAHPKYAQLREVLKQAIERGEYPVDSPLPTQRALMGQYRLSFSTVKRALDEIVREGLAHSRPGKGIFVAEASKGPARTKLVFTLFGMRPEMFTVHPMGWIAGLLKAQHEFDFLMHLESDETLAEAEAKLRAGGMNSDGAIIMHLAGRFENLAHQMNEVRFPYVILDVPLRRTDVNAVIIDHEAGAFDVVTHLIRRGHRRIAFVGGAPGEEASHAWFNAKYQGYLRALKTAGIEARPEDAMLIEDFDEAKNRAYARQAVRNLLPPRRPDVTAVFVSIESLARATLRGLADVGMRVPDEVAVVGFNNGDPNSPDLPTLTTIDVPLGDAGPEAVRLLVAQIEGRESFPQQRILRGSLIVGESSGPHAAES